MIDPKVQALLIDAVAKIKADYAEIRAESNKSDRISFRGPEPEVISQPSSSGYFVRVLINGSWGVATFNDINLLPQKIADAVSFAKLQGQGNVVLADVPLVQDSITATIKNDFRQVPFKDKVELIKHYNQLMLKNKSIQSTSSNYADSILTKFFVNSKGSVIYQERPYIRFSYAAIASVGDVIESYRSSVGHQGGFDVVKGLDKTVVSVAKESVEIANASKVKSGNYTVILDPFMAGTFAHEAFGHFSEADFQYENPMMLSQMAVGTKLGSEIVNIVDDPSINDGWGNFSYDDEGVKALPAHLLTAGVITERLHSLETAGKLHETANGRARADGFGSVPVIRMSNTFFEPGKSNLQDMIKSIKHGILVINWQGGMTAMEMFTFTALYGVMIENGKLTNKVRGVKLSGNVFETLKNIEAVSSDFATDQGTCGKQGQYMPVGAGGGYVQIKSVSVGGS